MLIFLVLSYVRNEIVNKMDRRETENTWGRVVWMVQSCNVPLFLSLPNREMTMLCCIDKTIRCSYSCI